MDFLTTEQAAERLGIGLRRVQTLVQNGRLPAGRFGRALMIKESDLALVAERKTGRPAKKQAATDSELSTETDAQADAMPAR